MFIRIRVQCFFCDLCFPSCCLGRHILSCFLPPLFRHAWTLMGSVLHYTLSSSWPCPCHITPMASNAPHNFGTSRIACQTTRLRNLAKQWVHLSTTFASILVFISIKVPVIIEG
ncbi:hypothetical protein F4604DRAFT_1700649 [Suillus subluteus]|nr:hypothetical protein F4604DRAFT_1700649 [Suillus subluteus]